MKAIIKKLILLNVVALSASLITECSPTDAIELWLIDSTLRSEGAGNATIKLTDGTHLFYVDKGELFSSTKNKMGYSSRDGVTYYFVEWNGDFSVGSKSGATLRTQSGTVTLQSLQVVQSEGGIVWVKYKQTASSTEGRIALEL